MSHREEVERLRKRSTGFMEAAAERLKVEEVISVVARAMERKS